MYPVWGVRKDLSWCIMEKDGEIRSEANETNCFFCGHCIAVCPTDSLLHHGLDMKAFTPIEKPVAFKEEEFFRFLRERRSHRSYLKKKIPQEVLEKLVEACRYAPTGSNKQKTHLLILQNEQTISKLSSMTIQYIERVNGLVERKMKKLSAEGKEDSDLYRDSIYALSAGTGVVDRAKAGLDPIFFWAPAVFIFHSDSKRFGTPHDDCVIAAQTITLYARTLGLESCYIGAFMAAAFYDPSVMEEIHLPPKHQVYSVLTLGYPGQTYLKDVDRKPLTVRWE